MEKKFEGLIPVSLIDEFPSGYPNRSFFNYVANCVSMEGFFSVTGMLFPEFTLTHGHVFLAENYPMLQGNFTTRFGNDRRTVERYVNLFCVSDFYLLAADGLSADEKWQLRFAKILMESWQNRLKAVFPDRTFEFEITTTGLFDEDGVCLTFSQKESGRVLTGQV